MELKDKLKIGASVLAGGIVIYASEKYGFSDLAVNYEIWKASFFGEGVKNIAEYLSPWTRIAIDVGIGGGVGALVYAGLETLDE